MIYDVVTFVWNEFFRGCHSQSVLSRPPGKMKLPTLFLFFLSFIISFVPSVSGQLPPTVHRIQSHDSAVDLNTAQDRAVESAKPELGQAWEPNGAHIRLTPDETLAQPPLEVTFWTRVSDPAHYAIFVAHELKSSPNHWEIFSEPVRGQAEPRARLAVYLPGNQPDHVRGTSNLADGKWHFVRMVWSPGLMTLYVDGRQEAQEKVARPFCSEAVTPESRFYIGNIVEESIPMYHAALDALCVKKGGTPLLQCDFEGLAPSEADSTVEIHPAGTGETCTFEQLRERLEVHSQPVKMTLSPELAAQNPEIYKSGGSLAALDRLFPTAFPNGLPEPTGKPAKNVPTRVFTAEELRAAIDRFQLQSVKAEQFRPGVLAFWGEQYADLQTRVGHECPVRGAAEQTANRHALVFPEETHPAQVLVRRIGALLESGLGDDAARNDFQMLKTELEKCIVSGESLDPIFLAAAAVRRNLMFSNPKLTEIDRIAFLARASYSGSRLTNERNSDLMGGHFATQVYGFNTIHGGGLFTISGWRGPNPTIQNLTAGRKVTNRRLTGQELNIGAFYTPDLSFDGKTLYFSYCESQNHRWFWSPQTSWNLFSLEIDAPEKGIRMLTDSPYNDFDVCVLPSGRLVFCSERRGGFIRCFGEDARLQVTTSVLHSCKPDGSDIYPISFFETSEWQPSVDNSGMLVYTRWDYTDRENCLGSNFWTCAPDGRNPRAPHGNYPFPWQTFQEPVPESERVQGLSDVVRTGIYDLHDDHRMGKCADSKSGLPMTEMQIRAIPGSSRYIFTAAPHHGETFGSICLLDLRVPNDNQMSQVRRVTPYTPFPESECAGRSQYRYGAPWPLDEQTFLCASWEDLIVLDIFGNEELVCERELLPINYDPRLRLSEPMPVRARFTPPVIPQQTAQGEDHQSEDQRAFIGVSNVNICDLPLPKDRPIKYLRVLQVVPKPNPWMNVPMIGYFVETTPRIPLGVVPVEADGSVFFEAPPGKQLLFQTLDANFQAVATMRAVTFVHPGEKLVCTGCHEPTTESVRTETSVPSAFLREPSTLQPECGPVEPIAFVRFLQGEIDQSCLPCHVQEKKGPQTLNYAALRPYVYSFAGGMRGAVTQPNHGGSRSIPGRFGSSISELTKILNDANHREHVTPELRHKFILWMDANAPRYGAFRDAEAQDRGELVWPILDCADNVQDGR